ncbi:hypothetical protein C8Z91_34240 [Paenibacillus elgii]|uniref:ABC transporter substrate-binding protein n=1 Tax=Paenibacillus elgii TaxID=189691 RepID=A0A2T6FSR0_9BACL|nr:extracellular solute-binding protein [Paenibacillus elgii]PUA34929.1 hypothetical protein C8Z91_34240 [Paenibacillus elgii]
MKIGRVLLIGMAICLVLSSCKIADSSIGNHDSVSGKIKILYNDELTFMQEYGGFIISEFPNIDIEIIEAKSGNLRNTTIREQFVRTINEQRPDIIISNNLDIYSMLIQEGVLFSLQQKIRKDNYDVTSMHQGILDLIRSKGDSELYGLAPFFTNQAIFYNKDIFNKYGVPHPKDNMTWPEIFSLAERVSSNNSTATDRVYGFNFLHSSPFINTMYTVAPAYNLRVINPDTKELNIGSKRWKEIFTEVIGAYKKNVIPNTIINTNNKITKEELQAADFFLRGKSAMTLDSLNLITRMNSSDNKSNLDWAVVTAPVGPENLEQAAYYFPSSIFSIFQNSSNKDLSWEIIKYLNSRKFAKINSKLNSSQLTTRLLDDKDNIRFGKDISSFYKLTPILSDYSSLYDISTDFVKVLNQAGQEEFDKVLNEGKLLDVAIQNIIQKSASANPSIKK